MTSSDIEGAAALLRASRCETAKAEPSDHIARTRSIRTLGQQRSAWNGAFSLQPGRTRTVRMLGQELAGKLICIADLPVIETFGLEEERL